MSFNKLMNSAVVESSLLVSEYFPFFNYYRKAKAVKKAALVHEGENCTITISRYRYADAIIPTLNGNTEVVCADHYFDYTQENDTGDTKVWYVNFADPVLFTAYATALFAQDEIQTLEMPLLAAVREYLVRNDIPDFAPYTTEKGEPTPFLIKNVPYWNRINTNPQLASGEHESIYGYHFALASEEAIEKGVTAFDGKINSNIMAIAAPIGEDGTRYLKGELKYILKTLLCSFSAAADSTTGKTVIHSGNWGCGAFGGNKELMYLAQLICADICGVDRLVLHMVDENAYEAARRDYTSLQGEKTLEELVDFLDSKRYMWGESDGN